MARRIIVNTFVGLGTNLRYNLRCPSCGMDNKTNDAGKLGIITKDGKSWYRFDCHCGVRYKAIEIPMIIGLKNVNEIF